jgi:hypothetical protein
MAIAESILLQAQQLAQGLLRNYNTLLKKNEVKTLNEFLVAMTQNKTKNLLTEEDCVRIVTISMNVNGKLKKHK